MTKKISHRKVCLIAGIVAAIMFGFCFLMVPFYSVLCKVTGVNTSVPSGQLLTPTVEATNAPDTTRDITVQFLAETHRSMPWEFYPRTKVLHVHPGENNKVLFYVKNPTNKKMTVQAVPSMTPPEALSHFHKIECFCFTQQSLQAHESKDMPLVFQIDKELPKNIHVISLVYTLFDVTKSKQKGS